MKTLKITCVITLYLAMCLTSHAQTWQSKLIDLHDNGYLNYNEDADGFIIPDFSYAGYKNGQPIPDVQLPQKTVTISPLPNDADNTAHIQAAIDEVGKYPIDSDGFRGVVYLNAGKYFIDRPIFLKYSGVILRGAGSGTSEIEDPINTTIIYGRNTNARAIKLVQVGGDKHGWGWGSGADRTNVTTEKVMPSDLSFEVENASGYKVGDLLCLKYPVTEAWLESVQYGGNTKAEKAGPWNVNNTTLNMSYHRYVTAVDGNKITFDAPLYNTLNKAYSQAYIYKFSAEGMYYNIGVESLRIGMERTPASNTTFLGYQNCLDFISVENCWAKDLYLTDYVNAGIETQSATRVTIENCSSINPSGYATGMTQYNFENNMRSQLILYKNCRGEGGRHHYISNGGASVNGIAIVNFKSRFQKNASEGHRLWSQGILFDSWTEEPDVIGGEVSDYKMGMFLRNNMGDGHGWGGTQSVFWNCNIGQGGIYLDKVPTGQNYAIGCTASTINRYLKTNNAYQTGYVEGQNRNGLQPASLYEAQLYARINNVSPIMSRKRIEAEADTYIRKGSYQNDNYGKQNKLILKTVGPTSADTREIYLKFDISNLEKGSRPNKVLLALHILDAKTPTSIDQWNLDGVETTWEETILTWQTKPIVITPKVAIIEAVASSQFAEFDVTDYIVAQLGKGAKSVAFSMYATENSSAYTAISSRESQAVELRPNLIVNSVIVTGISLSKSELVLRVGDTHQLMDQVLPADASNQSILWTSSNNSVAKVDTNGLVTGLKKGAATIVATTENGSFTANCNVTVDILKEQILPVIEDAYTRGKSYQNINYGRESNLEIKNAGENSDYTRESYLQFDINSLNKIHIGNVLLSLYVRKSDNLPEKWYVHGVKSDWNENNITWNTRPDILEKEIAKMGALPAGSYANFDVTEYVLTELHNGSTNLSLCITGENPQVNTYFHSKEDRNLAYRPKLIVNILNDDRTTKLIGHNQLANNAVRLSANVIEINMDEILPVSIYSFPTGTLMYKNDSPEKKLTINIADYSSGIYIVNTGNQSFKIMK